MRRQKSLLRTVGEPLLVAVLLALAVRSVVRLYSVPTESMVPTLQPGDRIVVTRLPGDYPVRGDVVVFRDPSNPREIAVKRVVAIPGDLIDSSNGRLRVSGRPVAEPYGLHPADHPIAPLIVPAEHLFVLGDNRGNSRDSRHWGPLPVRLVVGRARLVLWHRGSSNRIFKWVE